MAKPRTAPPSAPKTAQDSKPAAAPAVTEEKPAETTKTPLGPPADGDVDAAASSGLGTGPALEPSANDQAPGAGGDASASAPPVTHEASGAVDAASGPGAEANSHDDDAPSRVCFEVLAPFKFRGSVVKPPAWLEISEDDAAIYQAAGVLDTEPAEPFDHV
ncbi:hypothetical protein CEQ03_04950 [Stenotrophomonas maltophilia]|uniref:hypothetical protein n=1 Tax=Stenotrophomonas maltophilia TaxID=40324 RepID=UPI000B518152|nr:hypothetical protein [Stenotrophomonas maltophilia]ASE52153.1 hypothetical protein CEQ03_04950 [Stenotrophomonas maltophilia]HEL3010325.1 hypothetical protein [Stenotrophomonas maltophilia]